MNQPTTHQPALSDAERRMLAYALDQAQEKIWSEDGFTDQDQAAVDSLRVLADAAPVVPVPVPPADQTAEAEMEYVGGCTCDPGPEGQHAGHCVWVPALSAHPAADRGAVLPPPALTEEGRLRAQVEVLQQDAERDRGLAKVGARCMRVGHQGLIEEGRIVLEGWRFALSTALGLDTEAPWEAIHEQAKELRRMAAEGQPTETHSCRNCEGIDPDACLFNPDRHRDQAHAEGEHAFCGPECGDELPAVGEQPETQETVLPCNWARTRTEHNAHGWEPQPGMDPVHCPGYPQPGREA